MCRRACYLSGYTVGKSFLYRFESDFDIEKSVEHASTARSQTARHHVRIDASIQCIGISDDGLYNFELRVHDALWRREQDAASAPSDEAQADADARFTRSLQRAFYYTQRCNMEIVNVFHALDESDATLNIKKNLVHAFDNSLDGGEPNASSDENSDDSSSATASAVGDGATLRRRYVKRRIDHLGDKDVLYEHAQLDDGSLRVDMSHEHDRWLSVR